MAPGHLAEETPPAEGSCAMNRKAAHTLSLSARAAELGDLLTPNDRKAGQA